MIYTKKRLHKFSLLMDEVRKQHPEESHDEHIRRSAYRMNALHGNWGKRATLIVAGIILALIAGVIATKAQTTDTNVSRTGGVAVPANGQLPVSVSNTPHVIVDAGAGGGASGITLLNAQTATGSLTGAAVAIPGVSAVGTLYVTFASITGSPSGCSVQLINYDSLGNAINNGSANSVTAANGVTAFSISPNANLVTASQMSANFSCSVYPATGTISASFIPATATDRKVSGPDAQAATQTQGPVAQGGLNYSDNKIYAFAVDPITKGMLLSLPQQSFLNTQMFSDVSAASPTRGDLITAQGATPKWNRLPIGTASQALFGGTEPNWSSTTLLNGGFSTDTISSAVTLGDLVTGNATPKWTDLAAPIATGTGFLSEIPNYVANPSAAPTLTANNSGGSLAGSTTYFVKVTFSNANGETAGSAEASTTTPTCAVANTCSITITAPGFPSGATSYSGYLGSATGLEHLSGSCQNVGAGVNCTIPAVGAGGLPPTYDTATIVTVLQWKKHPWRFANDFPNLQMAIDDACAAGGGTVYLAGQTYAVNSALTLCSNLRITGDSPASNDTPTNPSKITTTLSSGALFNLTAVVNVELSRFAVVKSGTAGGTAILCNWCQYSLIANLLIKGAFLNGIVLNPISGASTEFNTFRDILISGLTTNGVGCTLDSGSVSNANVNSNYFMNVFCDGGTNGIGLKTAGGVAAQPFVNENQFYGGQFTASGGTGVQIGGSVGQPSTRNLTMVAPDIEGNNIGVDLQAANDGFHCWSCNLIINTTNTQIAATATRYVFIGNFAGASQNYSTDPAGNSNFNSISTGGAAPQGSGSINMSSGAGLMASGTTVANVNTTDVTFQKMTIRSPNTFRTTADFVTAANTNLQTITGLSWILPANTALNVPFYCEILYNQQTAAVADAFGIQAATFAPTQIKVIIYLTD